MNTKFKQLFDEKAFTHDPVGIGSHFMEKMGIPMSPENIKKYFTKPQIRVLMEEMKRLKLIDKNTDLDVVEHKFHKNSYYGTTQYYDTKLKKWRKLHISQVELEPSRYIHVRAMKNHKELGDGQRNA